MEPRTPLIGLDRASLVQLCRDAEVKDVHAKHLLAGLFRRNQNLDDIIELPKKLKAWIAQHHTELEVGCSTAQLSDDGTHKFLLKMPDCKEVETVLIPTKGRVTQCVSTQVGCAAGCQFCLTATAGLTRNLSVAEIVAQVRFMRHRTPVRNLVLMGMGEPLHNYESVHSFVRIVTDPLGMAFSPRHVTLSTVGMVPGIYRMIEDEMACNLAVSLNATTDELRSEIMPVNKAYPLAVLLQAMKDYTKSGRHKRVFVEYVLLAGVNDRDEDALRLKQLLKDVPCTLNLLPFNAFSGSLYQAPSAQQVLHFQDQLLAQGIFAIVRESRGRDISAACGQLKTEQRQRASR
ncbi:MAG: 23S rRNA (adenine(2503)-C(2))-methyltransferase RlmN [Mariprofundaceae bacterium]|nr:23S rRNA (adenine(2503)-C(2))-methyltransferase RlmN [Mariprofundaceae bacterium]